jgi:ketosteroid isomerase-like protein
MGFSLQSRAFAVVCLLVAALLVACDSGQSGDGGIDADAAVQALLAQDEAFAAAAAKEGVAAAYSQFLAEDAVQLPDGGFSILGQQAIVDNILATLGNDDISLSWQAEDAVVAASDDLGYTWGSYYFETVDENGEVFGNDGKYVNIWRKSAAGDWRVVLDISNQNELIFIESPDAETRETEVF